MNFVIRVCCQNPYCKNESVQSVCPAIDEEAADDTANQLNISSTESCQHCGQKLIYFAQPDTSL